MTMTLRRGFRSPPTVDADKVERLGHARGTEYVRYGGDEFYLSKTLSTPDEAAGIDGAIILRTVTEAVDEVSGQRLSTGHAYRLAEPVPLGTFERQRPRRVSRGARPMDALAGCALLRGRHPMILPAKGAAPIALRGSGGYAEGRAAVRGRDILPAIEGRGVRLELHHGALLPLYSGRFLPPDVADVMAKAERLLIGYVAERDGTGLALRCELEDGEDVREAWTIAVGGLAACRACMEAER